VASVDESELQALVTTTAEQAGFSGLVRVDRVGRPTLEWTFGLADRRWAIPFTTTTRASIASGTKGFTALTVMALVERGRLSLDTRARELLGDDLPLIDDGVTVEHLLRHRSGIGDYLDEDILGEIDDYVMPVPVHRLDSTPSFLAVLDGFPQVTPPGTEFRYNNGGFVVLALVAERAGGLPFEQLVLDLVCTPAGMPDTSFVRSDALPPGTAAGYVAPDGLRTNILHLPLVGSGDGGLFTTLADMTTFWQALHAGQIVSPEHVALMTAPRDTGGRLRYGLGFWISGTDATAHLEGYDAGVSFRSAHDPVAGTTLTVIANTSPGAWPMLDALGEALPVSM
jgi:CubicO group peptidase (beta-lactamase class C family)